MATDRDKVQRRRRLRRVWQFVSEDAWDIELTSLSKLKCFGVKSLRVIHLVVKGFKEDECPLHASALTFNSLLAVVPILALSLALARVFGGAELAETRTREVVEQFTSKFGTEIVVSNAVPVATPAKVIEAVSGTGAVPSPEEFAVQLNGMLDAGFAHVQNINFAELGGLGFILLIWMVVAVLGRVEASFNRVWGVSVERPMLRKFTDYLFMVIILPFLITMATAMPIAEMVAKCVNPEVADRINALLGSGYLKTAIVLIATLATFSVIIKFMPNTKVRIRPALVGGIVAGLLFIAWLWTCASFQMAVGKYSKLYGSFAIVPIVLFWVYVSWEILLFGAEVAFAVQNCTTYRMEQGARRANMPARITLALSIVVEAGRAMLEKTGGLNVADYARDRIVPVRFINDVADELVQEGFLASLAGEEGCFVLLGAPDSFRVKDIVDAVVGSGVKPEALGLKGIDPRIEQVVQTAADGIGGSLSRMTIQDLIKAS